MREIIGTVLLASACLFLAGLNLWNEFKDWFNKTYQRKDEYRTDTNNGNERNKKGVPDIMGKPKTVFKSLPVNQNQKKEQEAVKEEDENSPIHSIDLEKEAIPLNIVPGKNTVHDQGVTVDEFQLLADTLQGKVIPKGKELQIRETLHKVKSTDLFGQITGLFNGAESIVVSILDDIGAGATSTINNRFDIGKYIN
ncbi:hypothetical protein [Dysgonomonas sp. 521]|uniref:hypothetical protein n=1 Tax=Dysgonomonas sp. 521 TaxID=2302932 RepID=UPI0013D74233|nr:hypothetical protein [Dysgonomonas sp. 521]